MKISKRAEAVLDSATMAVATRAMEMKAKGVDVVSFGAGEPDFFGRERVLRCFESDDDSIGHD